MTVRCPSCASEQASPAEGGRARSRMVRCARCGTRWLPRPYEGLLPIRAARTDVTEAVVIEDVPPVPSRRALPPPAPRIPAPVRAVPAIDRRLWGVGAVFGAVLAAVVLWSPLVSALPDVDRLPVEVGLLEFQKIRSETVSLGGVPTLIVEGEIANRSADTIALPAIAVTLKSESGEAVTSWLVRLAADGLAAGRTIGFRSALASPPPGATQVTLHLSRRDGRFGFE